MIIYHARMTGSSYFEPGRSHLDVNAFPGVDPTGSRDCTLGIQAALDAVPDGAYGGGVVRFSAQYVISSSLVPKDGTVLCGENWPTDTRRRSELSGYRLLTQPLIERTDVSHNIMVERLSLIGNNESGCTGIYAAHGYRWIVRECFFSGFGDQGIVFRGGACNVFRDLTLENTLLVRSGRSAYIGVVDLGSTDDLLDRVEASASLALGDGSGYIAAIVIRGGNSFLRNCIAEESQFGIALVGEMNHLVACRADLNNGQGFQIDSPANTLQGCVAYANSTLSDNAADGFVITATPNTLVACLDKNYSGQRSTRYSYTDTSTGSLNYYIGCRRDQVAGTGLYNFTGTPSHWP